MCVIYLYVFEGKRIIVYLKKAIPQGFSSTQYKNNSDFSDNFKESIFVQRLEIN